MAALSPLASGTTTGATAPTGFAPPAPPAPPISPPQAQRPHLVVVNGRLVVAGSDSAAAAQGAPAKAATQATPHVNTPDSEKSLAQAVASESGPSAATPPSRAELESQLATIASQVANSAPGTPEATHLERQEAQIRQALAELTIAPGSYGAGRPNLRGLTTDKVA